MIRKVVYDFDAHALVEKYKGQPLKGTLEMNDGDDEKEEEEEKLAQDVASCFSLMFAFVAFCVILPFLSDC